MTAKIPLAPFKFKYEGQDKTIISNSKDVVTHSKQSSCPITSCKLMAKGCLATLASPLLEIEPSTGKVTAKAYVPGGYEEEICYQCTVTPVGGATQVTKTVDNVKIIQEPADCSDALTTILIKLNEIKFDPTQK